MRASRLVAVAVVLCLMVVALASTHGAEEIDSHLGNRGPAFEPGITPSKLGWGSDDQVYPDRFVVFRPDGSELVWVPAGEFLMGSTPEQVAEWLQQWPEEPVARDVGNFLLDAETPQRRVEMNGFWMGKHEVSNAQCLAFCEATGRAFPSQSRERDDHPVVQVSWEDAIAYAERQGLALPTEAQWEYAARGREGRTFPWGDDWNPEILCWSENQGPGETTFPVGTFPHGASWCGALDMAGNVWEWCADWFDPDYYQSAPNSNPLGPSAPVTFSFLVGAEMTTVGEVRVLRGGAFGHDGPGVFRCAGRLNGYPWFRHDLFGFRVCITP